MTSQASKSGRVGWARVAYVDSVLSLSAPAPASSSPNPSPALGRILNCRLLSSQHYYSFYHTKSQDLHKTSTSSSRAFVIQLKFVFYHYRPAYMMMRNIRSSSYVCQGSLRGWRLHREAKSLILDLEVVCATIWRACIRKMVQVYPASGGVIKGAGRIIPGRLNLAPMYLLLFQTSIEVSSGHHIITPTFQ